MKTSSPFRFAKITSAFSLVEVAISLGIVAFGLTAILGLMPLGFTQFREAMDVTITSQIASVVSSDMKQASFDQLVDPSAVFPPRYFNDQGVEVDAEKDGIYTAVASVVKGAKLPEGVENQSVARVRLEIKAHRGASGQTANRLSRTTFVVADRN